MFRGRGARHATRVDISQSTQWSGARRRARAARSVPRPRASRRPRADRRAWRRRPRRRGSRTIAASAASPSSCAATAARTPRCARATTSSSSSRSMRPWTSPSRSSNTSRLNSISYRTLTTHIPRERAQRNQGNRASLNPAREPVRGARRTQHKRLCGHEHMPVAASSRVTYVPRAAAARARLALARPVVAAHQRPTLPFEIHRKGAAAAPYGVDNMRVWRRTKGMRSPRRGTRRGHAPATPRGMVEVRPSRPEKKSSRTRESVEVVLQVGAKTRQRRGPLGLAATTALSN